MPLALAIIGIALLVSAIRGTQGDLFSLLSQDVLGWAKWAAAIVAVGALGYIPHFEGPSRVLLALVLIVLVVANKGLFTKLAEQISAPASGTSKSAPPAAAPLGPAPVKVQLSGGGGGGLGGALGGITDAISGGGGGSWGGAAVAAGTGGL